MRIEPTVFDLLTKPGLEPSKAERKHVKDDLLSNLSASKFTRSTRSASACARATSATGAVCTRRRRATTRPTKRHGWSQMTTDITSITWTRCVSAYSSDLPWFGALEELDFLYRLFDLEAMPSTDHRQKNAFGDIYQHRVMNPGDWDDDWIFSDSRFGLTDGEDEAKLNFIAETLHPEVRPEADSERLVRRLNAAIVRDGWELFIGGEHSGYPVYHYRRCRRFTVEVDDAFPIDIMASLPGIVTRLKNQGANAALQVIMQASFLIALVHVDPLNDEHSWKVTLRVSQNILSQLDQDLTWATRNVLADAIRAELEGDLIPHRVSVHFAPCRSIQQRDWRSDAAAFISGAGITNQGRVRSENIASLEHDGLLFRSLAEICFYKAAKKRGLVFAPLPVFLRGGIKYKRIEPDFVVLVGGKVIVVEIDGDTFHLETPVQAQRRLEMVEEQGAKVLRFAAAECNTDKDADDCVQRVIEKANKM